MSRPEAQPRDPLIGARIDERYTVHSTLGRGGMGVVYAGVHDELGRPVAIKVLNAAWASDPTAVARFLREARTAGSMSHGNIVDVSDLGRLPDGRPYLVMPRIAGTDLATLLQQSGRQPPKRVAELLTGVAAALELIHAKGLVHRDIKPANLMYVVREDGSETVMLLDFGIAALVASNEPRLTRQGAIFGTPEYLPPEVWDGKVPDRRGDVYALATVAFELMTGELPFTAENVMHILPMKLKADAPSMTSVSPMAFPAELEVVIARGLAREPVDRYSTASELVNALKAATLKAKVSWRPGVMGVSPAPQAASTLAALIPETDLEEPLSESLSNPPTFSSLAARSVDDDESRKAPPVSTSILRTSSSPPQTTTATSIPTSSVRRALPAVLAGAGLLLSLLLWRLSSSQPEHTVTPAPPTETRTPDPVPPQVALPENTIAAPAPKPPDSQAIEPVPARTEPAHAPATAVLAPAGKIAGPREPKSSRTSPVLVMKPAPATRPAPEPAPIAAPQSAPQPTRPARDTAQADQLTREGTSALLSGQVAHATDLLHRATQADPSYAPAFRNLGLALERTGRSGEAVASYQQYLRLDPRGAQADKVRARVEALRK